MSSAQDEFNRLALNSRERYSTHPEDRDNSDRDSNSESDDDANDQPQYSDDEDHDPTMSRTSTYHVPNIVYDANTGPKGVIADAQAFERARKGSFRRTLFGDSRPPKSVTDDATLLQNSTPPDGSGSEEDEDRFLRRWRESRMAELRQVPHRRPSPRRKFYGSVDTVDAVGYLDAIEKVPSETIVVVCVYDPESKTSAQVEDCLETIARRQPSVHFIKLHYEIAEMDHIRAPALLAYRGGDVFATIVEIPHQIPRGKSCTADTLEDLLKMNRVL